MNFTKALFISFIGHCFLLAPVGHFWAVSPRKKTSELEINYYKLQAQIAEVLKAARVMEKKSADQPSLAAKAPEKPKEGPSIAAKKSDGARSRMLKKAARLKAPYLKPMETAPAQRENLIPASIPGTTLPNTPECMNYYQYIREEIRRSLKRNYTADFSEGEVGVLFVLNQAGELVTFDFDEAKSAGDYKLRQLAYKSIDDTSPFKPFPRGLTKRQISFNLTVVFKKD